MTPEQEFLQVVERLSQFADGKPSRRFLVAIDQTITHLERFWLRVLEARSRGDGNPELLHWSREAEVLIESLKEQRDRIAAELRKEMN